MLWGSFQPDQGPWLPPPQAVQHCPVPVPASWQTLTIPLLPHLPVPHNVPRFTEAALSSLAVASHTKVCFSEDLPMPERSPEPARFFQGPANKQRHLVGTTEHSRHQQQLFPICQAEA